MCEWKNQNFLKPLQVSHKSFSISCAISVSKPLLLSDTQLFVSFLICIHHRSNQTLVFLEYRMTLMALCSLTWSVNWIVQAQATCALWVTRIRPRGIWGRPELSKYSPSLKYECSPHLGPQVHWEVRATGKGFWCFGNCRTFKAQLHKTKLISRSFHCFVSGTTQGAGESAFMWSSLCYFRFRRDFWDWSPAISDEKNFRVS